ncbi:hypothetical protein EZV62_001602 [Acer yangbiense]|uniref:Uncharacterized protein n=1 Tax=Acer yangbiense TaxID=1000413 RepID=A0A5C7IUT2_9ROSI|nr:hypothetical protein EZV62_001602 [Acer yangbiense]
MSEEVGSSVASPPAKSKEAREWVEDLQRTVIQSKDSAIRSARSLQHNSSTHLRSLQDFVPQAVSQYRTYEDAFFRKVKGGLLNSYYMLVVYCSVFVFFFFFAEEILGVREHPGAAIGIALTAGLLLMRGPRRFLYRHTLGRFQSEEAQFVRAEKNVKELNFAVDLMKKESRKLLERAALAEKDMIRGETELKNAGNQVQRLAKQVYNVEAEAAGIHT